MILAITLDKNTFEVFDHFGQTKNFYLFDTEKNEEKIVDNNGFSHQELVPYLASLNVGVVICGGIGNHAIMLLNKAGIEVVPGVKGNVEEVKNAYINGTIRPDLTAIHKCSHH